jgi:hypothetical protein
MHKYEDQQTELVMEETPGPNNISRNIKKKTCRFGYFINIVASLSKDYKITRVQMRIISQELKNRGIDAYGIDKYQQNKLFTEIVMKYTNVPENAIRVE